MLAAVGRRRSQASNTLRPGPERTSSRHLDEAEKGQAPPQGCLTPASDHEDSKQPSQPRRPLERAPPTGSQITAALNRSLSAKDMHNDETDHDDLNDLDGERPHQISFAEPSPSEPSDASTAVDEKQIRGRMPPKHAWRTYLLQEVAGDRYLQCQLLLMTMVTGALDAMTYTTYSVFTTKQTGNALFLALYAFRNPAIAPNAEENVGVSMGVFLAGAFFWGQLGRVSRQRRRIWLMASQLFQALSILAATAVRYWSSRQHTGPAALGVLALLSFAMSGQIATALNVNMPELNTTMITGAVITLMSDKNLFKLKNNKRTRRILFFASIEAGSFIGAALLNYRSPTATLLVCACIKFGIVATFLFNRGIVHRVRQLEDGRAEKTDGAITPVSKILWGD